VLSGAGTREGAAEGLEDEGDDVAGDEDPIEELGLEAGDGGVDIVGPRGMVRKRNVDSATSRR